MTITQAIEILEDILHFVKPGDPPDEHDAIHLGIEALKRIEVGRNNPGTKWNDPLPGETEE